MEDKHLKPLDHQLEDEAEVRSMDPREIEVRLAIADYVIRRVGGTPAGSEIFDALIKRFENRYPQHKLLAHFLTSPEHLEMYADDLED
ncbi:hypothetical protein [Pseudomonas weihenstephanensis]|uniref:hypothetical protein n=1 Tax=Pseudomonas weihenstephanensis TaxID=1608994 RepID=UPI001EEF206E|nr:hypothetical protein [Pseudomonas weihenstephanensis]